MISIAQELAQGQPTTAIARGEIWGPLHGLPISVKELFDIVGLPTTWGIPELKNNCPSTNAVAVDRLLEAGAIIFAKTNVPTLLANWQTFNPIYGTTNNPWNPSLSPGGSSGGSAAALAAGLTSLECGSDIGGSIRNPAHYCGVYGHKCSYGIIPMMGQLYPGHVAPVDFFVTGPMARSAADLERGATHFGWPRFRLKALDGNLGYLRRDIRSCLNIELRSFLMMRIHMWIVRCRIS